jgi:hypothetical protein
MYNEYKSMATAISQILNKPINEIKKDLEETDMVTTGDVQIQDRPLLKKKKVIKRDSLED